jgi:hypothetical protein
VAFTNWSSQLQPAKQLSGAAGQPRRTGSSERTLQRHSVLLDTGNSLIGDDCAAVLEDRGNVDFLP